MPEMSFQRAVEKELTGKEKRVLRIHPLQGLLREKAS
jgi:hypothetical protein